MTRRTKALFATLPLLIVLHAFAGAELEPYHYGDIEAMVPIDWKSSVNYAPGIRLLAASRNPDQPETTPQLLRLEATPLKNMRPKEFVEALLAHLGVDYRAVRENTSASTYELLLEGRTPTQPIKASMLSYSFGDKLYLYAFSALPGEFDELGGANLTEKAFATQKITKELIESDSDRADPTKVWAVANGFELTEEIITDTLAFGEFLASHPFSADERNGLRHEMMREFNSTTREDYDTYLQVGQIVSALSELSPMRRVTLRRDLMRDIHFELQEAEEDSPLMAMVYRHNPILGADQELGLVATKAGYLSLLASNLFVLERAGLEPISAAEIDESVEQLRNEYAEMSKKEKQYLADAEVNWFKLITMWQSWDAKKRKERMQWAGVYKVNEAHHVPKVARDLEHLAGFDMTSAQAMKLVELQLAISNLEYMRMMFSSYTDF